jgi:hypothetical protein
MLALMAGASLAAGTEMPPIEAATVDGKKVLLLPNGRWQYVDPVLAAEARKVAAEYPENKTRPVAAQGGFFGEGRLIMPGDKDYNRGSLNPKLR